MFFHNACLPRSLQMPCWQQVRHAHDAAAKRAALRIFKPTTAGFSSIHRPTCLPCRDRLLQVWAAP